MHVVLAGGGTAGHVEPALNTADAFRRKFPQAEITLIGTSKGLESRLVPERGYELALIPAVPMPRKPGKDLIAVGPRVWKAVQAASDQLIGVDVVVGFGGYVSLPVYLAARKRGIPIVIHEANAKPGLANRVGARFAAAIAESVPGSLPGAVTTGIPIRQAIATLDRGVQRNAALQHFGLDEMKPTLFVFGGSQGAQHLNEVLRESLNELLEAGMQVLHSVGEKNELPIAQDGYVPMAYIGRMDLAYSAADLAVCRAGAMTCAELAAVGLPALYVPLPIGNGEQRLNALPVIRAGGGRIVEDAAFTQRWLVTNATELTRDTQQLQRMSEAAAAYGVRSADEALVELALSVMEAR